MVAILVPAGALTSISEGTLSDVMGVPLGHLRSKHQHHPTSKLDHSSGEIRLDHAVVVDCLRLTTVGGCDSGCMSAPEIGKLSTYVIPAEGGSEVETHDHHVVAVVQTHVEGRDAGDSSMLCAQKVEKLE